MNPHCSQMFRRSWPVKMAERLGEQLLTLVKALLYTVWTDNHVLYPNFITLNREKSTFIKGECSYYVQVVGNVKAMGNAVAQKYSHAKL